MNVQFFDEVSESSQFLKPQGRGYGFLSGSPFSFTVYSNRTVETVKRLREVEEIEISRQSCSGDCE